MEAWAQRFKAGTNDQATTVAIDQLGNVIVTGNSHNGANIDYLTAKFSLDGTLLWSNRYNGPANGDDFATGMALDAAGNVLVTGYSCGANQFDQDFYTAKYAATDGALLWEMRFNENWVDRPFAIAADSHGNAVVTGISHTGISNYFHGKVRCSRWGAALGATLLWSSEGGAWSRSGSGHK